MAERPEDLALALPADKLLIPRPDGLHWLDRRHLLARLCELAPRRRLTAIVGQAGQGKSVLAAQFATHMAREAPLAWLRLGPEDVEPATLVQALLRQLRHLAGREAPGVTPDPGLQAQALQRLADAALGELRPEGEHYLVLDDVHRLKDCPASRRLLLHVIDRAPPNLHFVCTGRDLLALREMPATAVARIRNDELCFNERDIRRLAALLGEHELSPPDARILRRLTRGWATGVLLYLERLRRGEPALLVPPRGLRSDLAAYFEHQVMAELPEQTRALLVRLAWLDPLDCPSAAELLQQPDLDERLEDLVRRHLFIQRADDHGRHYRLHGLFRAYLREISPQLMDEPERQRLLEAASRRAEADGCEDEALRHALDAGQTQRMEELLTRHGRRLLFRQRPAHLGEVLARLPAERIEARPWLALLQAAVLVEEDRRRAARLLELAREGFAAANDAEGELIACAYALDFHITVDGRFNCGAPLLARCETLYRAQEPQLNPEVRLLVLSCMAGGTVFLDPGSERTRRYAEQALRLAQESDELNYEVRSRLVRGYDYICRGEMDQVARELEHLHRHLERPELHQHNRLLIRTLACNLLACTGRLDSFRRQAGKLRRHTDPELFLKSAMAPTLHRWQADLALAAGDLDQVLEHIDAGLTIGHAAFDPHVRSQLLQYRGLVRALRGRIEPAREDAAEALALRREAGSHIHSLNNAIFVGATYAALSDHGLAQTHLDEALELARAGPAWFSLAGVHLHRADLMLAQKRLQRAADEVGSLLAIMRGKGYSRCMAWLPESAERVLGFAVRHGIEADYARRLAAEQLGLFFDDDHQARPLLRLNTLGTFEIRLGEELLVSGRALTPRPQQYVATLLAAPNRELARDTLQEVIWPDAGQSTSKLYALRNRIKNAVLREKPEIDPEQYFVLRGSVARVEHAWIDAEAFAAWVRQGIQHWRDNQPWQANLAFFEAHRLWKGRYFATAPETDLIRDYRAELDRLNEQRVTLWADMLCETGDGLEAIEILAGYFESDPTNEEVVARLHGLYQEHDNPIAARKLLRRHQQALEAEGYSAQEIRFISGVIEDSARRRY